MSLNTISTSSIVDGQIVYASHVLRIINALDGTASNSILINGDLIQGTGSNVTNDLNSHAEGNTTVASGGYSHAEGYITVASGPSSHAEGYDTTASGDQAHAEGGGTIASGNYSHAEGSNNLASGNLSHAEGTGTTSSGIASHAEGTGTTSSGIASHAEGETTFSKGNNSHSEGLGSISSGSYSHAEGQYTVASGTGSHAEGAGNTALGDSSHAEGNNTVAVGIYSHAEGRYSYAEGGSSHAEGYRTSASGVYSHAEGYFAEASGTGSHAEGLYTIAYDDYQTAVGQYNKDLNTNDYFVVGVGTSTGNRKDGLGVNSTRTYVSNSLYLPDLTNVSKTRVVTIDTDGRLFYQTTSSLRVDTASVALTSTSASYALTSTSASYASFALTASYVIGGGGGGTGSATPGSPNNSVQFNNSGVFGGSPNFTFNASTFQMYYTGALSHNGAYTLDGSITANAFTNPTTVVNQLTASYAIYAMTASYAQSTYNNLASGTTYGKVYHTTPIVDFDVTHVNSATPSLGNNIMTLVPLEIKKPKVLDEIVISVESNAGPGNEWTGSVRLGVYTDNGNMYPGSLIYGTGILNVSGSDVITDTYVSASNINTPISAGIIWLAYIGSGSNIGLPDQPLRPWGIDQNAITNTQILNAFLGHKFVDIGGGNSYMSSITGLHLSSSVLSSFPSTFPTNASASTLLFDGVATPFVYFSA